MTFGGEREATLRGGGESRGFMRRITGVTQFHDNKSKSQKVFPHLREPQKKFTVQKD